mmetsp:Transcript_45968/g.106904  ORF Transcript_45968/g.106904 Transcript_45968/m.106904 type:complete len:97 (-) Transcript_45968:194-484(-)
MLHSTSTTSTAWTLSTEPLASRMYPEFCHRSTSSRASPPDEIPHAKRIKHDVAELALHNFVPTHRKCGHLVVVVNVPQVIPLTFEQAVAKDIDTAA